MAAPESPPGAKRRILLVDDQPIFCEGVKGLLDKQPDLQVVGVCDRRESTLDSVRILKPDLVIMDLNLKLDIGLEFVKDLRAEFTGLRILIFTDLDEMIYGERALLAGARGYLMKTCTPDTLLSVVGTVLREEIFLSESLMAWLLKRMYLGKTSNKLTFSDPVTTLSDREFQVFELIGQGKGSREIADCLHLGIKTVENHREKLKRKLGLESATSLVHYATIWLHETNHRGATTALPEGTTKAAAGAMGLPQLEALRAQAAQSL